MCSGCFPPCQLLSEPTTGAGIHPQGASGRPCLPWHRLAASSSLSVLLSCKRIILEQESTFHPPHLHISLLTAFKSKS